MKKIDSLKEIQKIEIDILNYIVSICERENLRYFLAGGTLLGAIRHQGFIPWDNDMDISMPRPDYNRFIELMKNEDGRYRCLVLNNDTNYPYPFIKVVDSYTSLYEDSGLIYDIDDYGIYVDIFPIDGYGNDIVQAKQKFMKYSKILNRISVSNVPIRSPFKKKINREILHFVVKLFNRKNCFDRVMLKVTDVSFDDSKYVGSTFGLRGENEIIEREYFSKSIKVKFNGYEYNAPIGYDQYLKQMYGDYMKLPPLEDRVLPHNSKAYWKEG